MVTPIIYRIVAMLNERDSRIGPEVVHMPGTDPTKFAVGTDGTIFISQALIDSFKRGEEDEILIQEAISTFRDGRYGAVNLDM